MPDGDLVHYIDQVDTPNPVHVRDWTGARAPLHAVSSGQVLLAFRPPAAIERYLGGRWSASPPAPWPMPTPSGSGCTPSGARATPGRWRSSIRDLVGRGADRRGSGRGHRRGPCPRAVVPLPGGGLGGGAGPGGGGRGRADRRGAARGLSSPGALEPPRYRPWRPYVYAVEKIQGVRWAGRSGRTRSGYRPGNLQHENLYRSVGHNLLGGT